MVILHRDSSVIKEVRDDDDNKILYSIICNTGHGHVMDVCLHVLSAELCFLTASFPYILSNRVGVIKLVGWCSEIDSRSAGRQRKFVMVQP